VENAATPKMTLSSYLARRGTCKALTGIEAQVFGVPFPLVAGWAQRHGAVEITLVMIEQLRAKIGAAQSPTTAKAKRGLDAALGLPVEPVTLAARVKVAPVTREFRVVAPQFPGFALRTRQGKAVGATGLPWK
jgi:hypothetical protein